MICEIFSGLIVLEFVIPAAAVVILSINHYELLYRRNTGANISEVICIKPELFKGLSGTVSLNVNLCQSFLTITERVTSWHYVRNTTTVFDNQFDFLLELQYLILTFASKQIF
jgi:hypothetical protein